MTAVAWAIVTAALMHGADQYELAGKTVDQGARALWFTLWLASVAMLIASTVKEWRALTSHD